MSRLLRKLRQRLEQPEEIILAVEIHDELLASLKEVLSVFEAGIDNDPSFKPLIGRARKIINKATPALMRRQAE